MAGISPDLVSRLNDFVKVVRRRARCEDIHATVDAPLTPTQPITLRLQKEGTLVMVPLEGRSVEQFDRAGVEGPLVVELKQAFLRVRKAAEKRGKVFESPRHRARQDARKKSFL